MSGIAGKAHAAGAAVVGLARGRSAVPGAVVLAYHDVLPDGAPAFPYTVHLSRLRAHLGVVARLGPEVVSLRDLAAAVRTGRDVTGRVALVFDDALIGVHHLALPELAARGWPATLHAVVDRLGVEPPWWPGSQRTMTHAELAYPFGHHDPRVRDAVRAAGYATGWTFLNGRVVPDLDPWVLPRLTMHQGLTPGRLAWQLSRRAGDWPDSTMPVVHPHAVTPG